MKNSILLTTFLRFDSVERILLTLEIIKPDLLIVTSDGPRNLIEEDKVNRVRSLISDRDWGFKIITVFNDTNKGILLNLYDTLDFVFNELELESIIFIEDDIVLSHDFINFCEINLELYKKRNEIVVINGHNLAIKEFKYEDDYFLAKRLSSTAHAFWRRTYNELMIIKEDLIYNSINFDFSAIKNFHYRRHLKKWFKRQLKIRENISYELLFTLLFLNGGYSIVPSNNLVMLGGLDANASNSLDGIAYYPSTIKKMFLKPISPLLNELNHPNVLKYISEYDKQISKQLLEGRVFNQLLRKIYLSVMLFSKLKFLVIIVKLKKKISERISKNG